MILITFDTALLIFSFFLAMCCPFFTQKYNWTGDSALEAALTRSLIRQKHVECGELRITAKHLATLLNLWLDFKVKRYFFAFWDVFFWIFPTTLTVRHSYSDMPKKDPLLADDFFSEKGSYSQVFSFSRVLSSRSNISEIVYVKSVNNIKVNSHTFSQRPI